MVSTSLLLLLLPLALAWPMDEMMMKFMQEKEKEDGGDDKEMMMKYMMNNMMKKHMMKEHYPGDADGCKKEDDSWKEWMEKKKEEEAKKWMEEKEKQEQEKKMMEQWSKFKEYQEKKQKEEEREAEEEKEKMMEMWQKQKEMREREEKEHEFKEMIASFQNQKHKFAFKLAHEFLQLCHCGEISDQMSKLAMFEVRNGTDMMNNMTSSGAAEAMDSGDMETLARKMMYMEADEKKKVFMSGLIKSMCNGASEFIQHTKQFEELYLVKYVDNSTTTTTD